MRSTLIRFLQKAGFKSVYAIYVHQLDNQRKTRSRCQYAFENNYLGTRQRKNRFVQSAMSLRYSKDFQLMSYIYCIYPKKKHERGPSDYLNNIYK